MKYKVIVYLDQDEVRTYMVTAPDQITAENSALERVRELLTTDTQRWDRPHESIDFDFEWNVDEEASVRAALRDWR